MRIKTENQQLKKVIMMMRIALYSEFTIITSVVLFLIVRYVVDRRMPDVFTYVILLVMMLVLVLINGFLLIRDRQRFQGLWERIEQQDASYENIKALNHALRSRRHDFLNHIQILYTLMELGEYEKTSEYLDNLYEDVGKISARIKTKSVAVNALLQAKGNEAEKRGIDFQVDIKTKFDQFRMPDWEVCRVVANLIDNAFEACKDVHEPKVILGISEKVKSYELLIVNDSMPLKELDTQRLFETGYTTKKDSENHGMGLGIVKSLVEAYDGNVSFELINGQVEVRVQFLKMKSDN